MQFFECSCGFQTEILTVDDMLVPEIFYNFSILNLADFFSSQPNFTGQIFESFFLREFLDRVSEHGAGHFEVMLF